jgi:DNA polymerase III epsilon subunit-like protein
MRILVFDTETTGLPKSKIMNPDTLNLWPYTVQFSYVIYDTNLNDIVVSSDKIVKLKDGITMPEDSIKIHGITTEISQKNGINIETIINEFFSHLRDVDLLVGHNVSFDINMIKVELLRLIYEAKFISENEVKECKYNLHFLTNYKNICCTLQESIDLCNIKAIDKFGKEYTKFPKLLELHQKLFESVPNNLHNSFNDILVTLRCFMKLKYDIDLNEKCNKFIKISKDIQLL